MKEECKCYKNCSIQNCPSMSDHMNKVCYCQPPEKKMDRVGEDWEKEIMEWCFWRKEIRGDEARGLLKIVKAQKEASKQQEKRRITDIIGKFADPHFRRIEEKSVCSQLIGLIQDERLERYYFKGEIEKPL